MNGDGQEKDKRRTREMINLIVAIDEGNAIGKDGGLLCHLPADLKHFKELTTGHTIVMGKKTYLSFPRRPLPNRRHLVLTHDKAFQEEGIEVVHSQKEALEKIGKEEDVFVIGGASVYAEWIEQTDRMYITAIKHRFEGADTYFPEIDWTEWEMTEEIVHQKDEKNPYDYIYKVYARTRGKR